jgi:hypothetical protein
MSSLRSVAPLIPFAAFVFAVAHVGFEYFNGGVKTHHFLARADLPGFSNWLGLLVLPLLAIALTVRAKSQQGGQAGSILPPALAAGTAGSLAYGAALAASFHFGLEQVSLLLFLGLFLCSIALPVYRAEYIFGFVVGMTIVFGSVIPLAFALVFGTISFALRRTAVFVLSALRKSRR